MLPLCEAFWNSQGLGNYVRLSVMFNSGVIATRGQEKPRGGKRSQEDPGGAKKGQEEPGGAMRSQDCWTGAGTGSLGETLEWSHSVNVLIDFQGSPAN